MGVLEGDGYTFTREQVEQLFIARHFPERSQWEDRLLLEYLTRHGHEFDRYVFSKRVGEGVTAPDDFLPGVQANAAFSSKRRIDMLAWSGSRLTIHEVKRRVTPSALGQVLNYRNLLRQEYPDADDAALVVIGETADPDALALLVGAGVTVALYPPADAAGDDAGRDRRALDGSAP
jgi:hypothetical protein